MAAHMRLATYLRKRPLNQSSQSQSQSIHHLEEQYALTTPSNRLDCDHPSSTSKKTVYRTPPHLHGLLPSLSNGCKECHDDLPLHANNLNCSSLSEMVTQRLHAARKRFAYPRFQYLSSKIHKWKKTTRYVNALTKIEPYLLIWLNISRTIFIKLTSIKCTCKQKLSCLFIIVVLTSNYVYFVKVPVWAYEEEWAQWEKGMQKSVADLIPPLPPENDSSHMNNNWHTNSLEPFPYLEQKVSDGQEASEYMVPIPDYQLIGKIRGKLAEKLRIHATQSCQNNKWYRRDLRGKHSLPVIGVTVATDTPNNRYLRRLLYTIDLTAVGSIVITWFDEQTEAQLVGKDRPGLSHEVVAQALQEFITRRGFIKIPWEDRFDEDATNRDSEDSTHEMPSHHTQLADTISLKLMSRIATSIEQYCRYDDRNQNGGHIQESSKHTCHNELLVLRFPTNLGCSSGVNNPLFTHPTAPHWLVANYDIAYPPGMMNAMGKELQKTQLRYPNLAVHTYGYIYGRGKLENPWSNFVMTSCAVANVGIWDENIFPAYYEDDDYRDRIRYIMGNWIDVVGDPDRYGDMPQKIMNDTHLIHYQTDRNVVVAHGPLAADTYLSGTQETMQKVPDEEKHWLRLWIQEGLFGKPKNPFHYERERWNTVKEVSNAEGFFLHKHGSLPDAGEHGKDALRYFGWHERFLLPFVNRTRVAMLRDSTSSFDNTGGRTNITENQSPWALWTYNATRRKCVHEAANIILSMTVSEERANATQKYKASCSIV